MVALKDANHVVLKLGDFKRRRVNSDEALESLRKFREYFGTERNYCFFDYVGFLNIIGESAETHQQVVSLITAAEEEVKAGTSGEGVDELRSFAGRFGDVCLVEGRKLSLAGQF